MLKMLPRGQTKTKNICVGFTNMKVIVWGQNRCWDLVVEVKKCLRVKMQGEVRKQNRDYKQLFLEVLLWNGG